MIYNMIRDILLTIVILGGIAYGVDEAFADKMTHKFKSPSFSGVNTSSHYLTIENQEHTRVMTIKEEVQALKNWSAAMKTTDRKETCEDNVWEKKGKEEETINQNKVVCHTENSHRRVTSSSEIQQGKSETVSIDEPKDQWSLITASKIQGQARSLPRSWQDWIRIVRQKCQLKTPNRRGGMTTNIRTWTVSAVYRWCISGVPMVYQCFAASISVLHPWYISGTLVVYQRHTADIPAVYR